MCVDNFYVKSMKDQKDFEVDPRMILLKDLIF